MNLKCKKCGKIIGETTSLKSSDMICSECLLEWQTEQEEVKEEIKEKEIFQEEFLRDFTREDLIKLRIIIDEYKLNK